MVHDDVDHEVHAAVVQGRAEGFEVVFCAKVRIEGVDVLSPVPAVARPEISTLGKCVNSPVKCLAIRRVPLDVGDDRRDPDGIEAHALNVVEFLDDTLPCPTTVLPVGRVAMWTGSV